MPLYDYECTNEKCKTIYEVKVPLSKFDEEIKCPDCGKPMKRLFTFNGYIKVN